jgi:hypothetical protein
MGRRGVVWDRQREEGTELGGLDRGKGWEGRKGREGDDLATPKKFLDPPPITFNFLVVDDDFLRLMKSSVFHNWHTQRLFTKFRFSASIAIA